VSGSRNFIVRSVGCKVNQAEAGALAHGLEAMGWMQRGFEPRLVVVFTCSVTARAAADSRRIVRTAVRDWPGAVVVATGCDAQLNPGSYQPHARVLPRAWLAKAPWMLAEGGLEPVDGPMPPPESGPFCPGMIMPGAGRSRAFFKIQDGCDSRCGYCVVPLARGRARSLTVDEAVAGWQQLGMAGAQEVVLTGIHLGQWGLDLPGQPTLEWLLRALLAAHPGPRLRLSSLECRELTPGLIRLVASNSRICAHLHVPLQTGSARLLEAMGREYSPEEYAQVLEAAAGAIEGVCIGADVIVGLPGEQEEDFRATYELIKRLPIAYLHVFPYSPRPGTEAERMGGRVDSAVVKARAKALRELGVLKREQFYTEQVGRVLEVVGEQKGIGHSDNYCVVRADRALRAGERVWVEVEGVEQEEGGVVLVGRVVGRHNAAAF